MQPVHHPVVATLLDPHERPRFDAAAGSHVAVIHANTAPEVIRAVRERPVDAVLVSAEYVRRDDLSAVAALVRRFPAVRTMAVVSRHDSRSSERLLQLGASGVSGMLDLSQRGGWQRLRETLTHPTSPLSAAILGHVMPLLADSPTDCRFCFESMIRLAPGVPTVRRLCRRYGVPPSTFVSRFFRAGLPSPKRYLARVRLTYAAALLESRGLSVADVAYRMEYSSPQSFGRHLRALTGMTASDFRRHVGLAAALERFTTEMIAPFRAVLRAFHPLETQGAPAAGPGTWNRPRRGAGVSRSARRAEPAR